MSDFTTSRSSPPFPSYLLPSLHFSLHTFRPRKTSTTSVLSDDSAPSLTDSISPASSIASSPTYSSLEPTRAPSPVDPKRPKHPKLSRVQPNTLRCSNCSSDIAFSSQIVSKGFTGRHGRAYLVSPTQPASTAHSYPSRDQTMGELLNTKLGRPVNRQLVTGAHVVADITCKVCGKTIGWKYVDARESSQRYKIGKFILETKRVVSSVQWEDISREDDTIDAVPWLEPVDDEAVFEDEDEVAFDSADEDECDELFAGTWDAETVSKRRSSRLVPRGGKE